MAKILNRIIKYSIYSLVFLVPVFFLPFSFEVFEFNKQYLLFFFVSLAFLVWMSRMIICDKEIRFRRTPLDIPILIFIFVTILNVVFSIDKTSSLFGFYGRFSNNLVGILSLGILYFLITNNVDTKAVTGGKVNGGRISLGSLINIFLWSVFFVLLIGYFSLFGVWQILSKWMPNFQFLTIMMNRIFNPIEGSLEALAIFLVAVTVLLVGLILSRSNEKKVRNCILLTAATIFLLIIDFTAAWVVLALTLTLFLVFAFWSRVFRERVNLLLIPIILVIISIIFIFSQPLASFKIQVLGFNILNPPEEILLDQKTTWQVAWGAVKNYPVLGSGVGTFPYDFSKFKPINFNQTNFWQVRFDRGGNQIAEIISTQGILGFLSWLVIIGLFLIISWLFLQAKIARRKTQNGEEKLPINNFQLTLFFTFLALFLGQFVYYQNTVLAFTSWLIIGLSVVSWHPPAGGAIKEKKISFKDFPEMSLVFNIVLILILLVILGSWFFAGRFYLADVNYRKGMISGKIESFERAANLNKLRSIYRITLSRIYFTEVYSELQKPVESQDVQKINDNFANAKQEAVAASQISPKWVIGFENLGMLYRDSMVFANNETDRLTLGQWAIDSFQKAVELEQTNPVFYTEIGKISVIEGKIDEAKKEIEKALELKSDYLDAQIQLALISEVKGNLQEAISKLEEIVARNPNSVEALFQLGRVYYNNNQIDKAIPSFQQAISIFPNHSNSLYSLGLAYQKKGQKEEALKMFEKVLELNPGNKEVIAKIEELKR